MSVTVRRNFAPLTLTVLMTTEDWARVGELARTRILQRTLQGQDADGQPFAPYSEGYAKRRAVEGLSPAVTLEVSGEMLRGIQIVPYPDRVELTF